MKGYKVFNPDWTCRGYQYEVGKTYNHEGNIGICRGGFHFCLKASDCFNYYNFDSSNKVAEVEAIGLVETEGDKSVTNEIKIVREIDWQELLTIVNEGKNCTGICNTGNRNTGDCNTGNCNTGDCNTGNWNTGNRNTGDWNMIDYSANVFSTVEEKIKIFDEPTNMTIRDWRNTRAAQILDWNSELTTWIYSSSMSDEEKEKYPKHEVTGGYLKKFTFKEMCENMWNNLTNSEKEEIKNIPNFNAKKFKMITGIEV